MVLVYILVILIFSLLLIKSADMIIIAVRRIAREAHTAVFAVSAIVLALGTSLPELFVGITSALEGSSNLAFGVVLGSNIANIALIGAASAFITGKVHIQKEDIRKDIWAALFAGLAPLFLALDLSVSRVDGLILLMLYFAYTLGVFRRRFEEIEKQQTQESFVYRFMREFKNIESIKSREFARLFFGLAILIFSADMIVKFSVQLAKIANIPLFLIGLFPLAVGTSLPELVFSLRSLENHQPSMFLGNLLGSVIANSTFIIGVTTLISPLNIVAFNEYLIGIIAFTLIFVLFRVFTVSKKRLDRWEAGVLLLLYFIFVLIEFT